MNKRKRVFFLVMDGAGVGEAPDAHKYGDEGSNTVGHVAKSRELAVPALRRLGLFNIDGVDAGALWENPVGAYMRLQERSAGKDTTTGHWELAGIVLEKPFPTYPHGFPEALIAALCEKIGRGVIGNEVASGTEIIARLGDEHVKTGMPIVYTSADSVLQIAAHEGVIPLGELYRICETARAMADVGRVIARPFEGVSGAYTRTANRKDFSVAPPEPNLLTQTKAMGLKSVGVGKIEDIFAFRGLTDSFHTRDNESSMQKVLELARADFSGLVFVNLIDFDMLYGHRNDAEGFAGALERLDSDLARLLPLLSDGDLLMITADHGCDPSTPSTDHSREYVPLLLYGAGVTPGNYGTRPTFADAGATAAHFLGLGPLPNGKTIL